MIGKYVKLKVKEVIMAMEMVHLKIVYFLSNMKAKSIMDVQNQKMEVILGAQQKSIRMEIWLKTNGLDVMIIVLFGKN